jgi:hypothetical protein
MKNKLSGVCERLIVAAETRRHGKPRTYRKPTVLCKLDALKIDDSIRNGKNGRARLVRSLAITAKGQESEPARITEAWVRLTVKSRSPTYGSRVATDKRVLNGNSGIKGHHTIFQIGIVGNCTFRNAGNGVGTDRDGIPRNGLPLILFNRDAFQQERAPCIFDKETILEARHL